MGKHDQFVDKLKNGQFQEAITQALSDAIELEITTWVVSGDSLDVGTRSKSATQPGQRLNTRINIVDGDIEHEVGRDFLDGSYACLRSFHEGQVKRGTEIIRGNLEAMQLLFNALMDRLETPSTVPTDQSSALLPAIALPQRDTAIQIDLDETQHPIDERIEVDSVGLETLNQTAIAPLELDAGQEPESAAVAALMLEHHADIEMTGDPVRQDQPIEPEQVNDIEADLIVDAVEERSIDAHNNEQNEVSSVGAIATDGTPFISWSIIGETTQPSPDVITSATDMSNAIPPSSPQDEHSPQQRIDQPNPPSHPTTEIDAPPESLRNHETQLDNECPPFALTSSDSLQSVADEQDDIVVETPIDLTLPTLADSVSPANPDSDDLGRQVERVGLGDRPNVNDDLEAPNPEQFESTFLIGEDTGEPSTESTKEPNNNQPEWDTDITDPDLEMLSPNALDSVLSMPLDEDFLDTEAEEMSEEEFSALLQADIDDPWETPMPEVSTLQESSTVVETIADSTDATSLPSSSLDQDPDLIGIDGEDENEEDVSLYQNLHQLTIQNESIEPDDTLFQLAEQSPRLVLEVMESSQSSTILQLSQPLHPSPDEVLEQDSEEDESSLSLPLMLSSDQDELSEQVDPELKILAEWVANAATEDSDVNLRDSESSVTTLHSEIVNSVMDAEGDQSWQSRGDRNTLSSAEVDVDSEIDDLEQSISSLSIELTDDALEDFQAFLTDDPMDDLVDDSSRDEGLAPEFAQSLDDLPLDDDNDPALSLDELLVDAESNLPETPTDLSQESDSPQESSQNWLDLLIIDDEADTVDETSDEFVSQEQRLEVLFSQDFNSEMDTEPDLPDDLLELTNEDLGDRSLSDDLKLIDPSGEQESHDSPEIDGDRNDSDSQFHDPDSPASPDPSDPGNLT